MTQQFQGMEEPSSEQLYAEIRNGKFHFDRAVAACQAKEAEIQELLRSSYDYTEEEHQKILKDNNNQLRNSLSMSLLFKDLRRALKRPPGVYYLNTNQKIPFFRIEELITDSLDHSCCLLGQFVLAACASGQYVAMCVEPPLVDPSSHPVLMPWTGSRSKNLEIKYYEGVGLVRTWEADFHQNVQRRQGKLVPYPKEIKSLLDVQDQDRHEKPPVARHPGLLNASPNYIDNLVGFSKTKANNIQEGKNGQDG